GGVERPPENFIDGLQLAGVTRSPQRCSRALREQPAHGQVDGSLAVVLLRELIETANRSEILRVARRPELRVCQAQIVAVEMRICLQLAREQATAQRAVGQGRKSR